MKAILYRPPSGAALEDVPVPPIKDGEVLISVDACGLCGSDLLKLNGPSAGGILGHEVTGRVAKMGAGVTGFEIGDRVAVAHHVPCLECHFCLRGNPSMCRQFRATNFDPGGFSEFIRLSEKHVRHTLLKIPDGLDSLSASFTEPLACVVRNVKRLKLAPGDAVGVVGLGSIGLLTGQLLRHLKVSVLGFDLDPSRLKLAQELGLATADGDDALNAISKLTQDRGLDVLTFTAGSQSLIPARLKWLRGGGTLNIFSELKPDAALSPIDLNEIYHRELTILSSYSSSLDDLRESLALLASGAVNVKPLTMRTYGLAEFSQAVAQTKSREIMKAILLPGKTT